MNGSGGDIALAYGMERADIHSACKESFDGALKRSAVSRMTVNFRRGNEGLWTPAHRHLGRRRFEIKAINELREIARCCIQ